MKNQPNQGSRRLRASVCSLIAAGLATTAQAVPDLVLNTFDSSASGWGTAWGAGTATFDAAQDNTGNGGGAVYLSADFSADQNTLTVFGNLPPNGAWSFPGPGFNLSDYASLEFDIKWDTTKTVSVADFNTPPLGGDPGLYIWGTDLPEFNKRPVVGNLMVPEAAATGWVHVSLAIDPTTPNIDPSVGVVFKKWISSDQLAAGGTYGFWLDNVILKGTDAPPPPPTVSLAKAVPGLALISASGGQYDRQNIVTVGDGYSWIGASGPVSYAVDLAKLADNNHPNYELHFFFVPGTPDTSRSDPDWHEANVLRWDIGNNETGGAYSTLRYKTNAADGNGIYYDAGQLGGPGSAQAAGTWTLIFNNDTDLTATAPDGTSFSASLPPEVVALFGNPLKFYVGVMPGATTRVGQMAILNGVKITGTPGAANLDSHFVGVPINDADWATNAVSAIGVQPISSDAAYWMNWTLPALGFLPQISGAVTGPWADPTLLGFEGGGLHQSLVLKSDLPTGNAAFFRLVKRSFTKLQILLPGETSAPNTPTGKTGTPDPITVGSIVNVTINAVDDNFNRVSASDMIHLVGSDNSVFAEGDFAMSNGTVSIAVMFLNSGTFTITASDLTDPTKTSDTSSPVTVE